MRAIDESNEAIAEIQKALDRKDGVWEEGTLDVSDRVFLQAHIANAKAIQGLAFAILEGASQIDELIAFLRKK